MIIDVHNHTLPPSMMAAVRRDPDRYDAAFEAVGEKQYLVVKGRRRGPIVSQWFDAERRLSDMDDMGVDIEVLSPQPFLLSYWADPGWAAELAAAVNQGMSEMAAETDRFWALGQLPLQSAERSVAELEHVSDLGLLGVMVGANVEGIELDDDSLEPVWARLDELEMTVFVHPVNPKLVDRMHEYHLTNLVGNPLDTTLALSRLILSGAMVRYPKIRFYFAHGGGFMPYLFGRIDHAFRVRDETATKLDVLPSEVLDRCYFDTITHSIVALRYLIETRGDSRVVVGTDYPAGMGDWAAVAHLTELALPEESFERIAHENAERLMGRLVAAARES